MVFIIRKNEELILVSKITPPNGPDILDVLYTMCLILPDF